MLSESNFLDIERHRRRRLLTAFDHETWGAYVPAQRLEHLVKQSLADLPAPGCGHTLERWQTLSDVAAHDLSLAKLFEGHTDALSILDELGDTDPVPYGSTWGVWAAEPPGSRVLIDSGPPGQVALTGRKHWCSGATSLTHALLTAWQRDGVGPHLVKLPLKQDGIKFATDEWHAVGMAGSASVDVDFDGARACTVGSPGAYLSRPGFWHGGAGIAACWYGGTCALAQILLRAVADGGNAGGTGLVSPFRVVALGKVDLALQQTAAVLRDAATWIDLHPLDDASMMARRVRLSAEDSVRCVMDEVGRALGATPYCKDASFARMAADLPVFVRQSGAERDFAALGERIGCTNGEGWHL